MSSFPFKPEFFSGFLFETAFKICALITARIFLLFRVDKFTNLVANLPLVINSAQKINNSLRQQNVTSHMKTTRQYSVVILAFKFVLRSINTCTSINLSPHGNPAVPGSWINADIYGRERLGKLVIHDRMTVGISIEDLRKKCM